MIDSNFYQLISSFTLNDLADKIDCEIDTTYYNIFYAGVKSKLDLNHIKASLINSISTIDCAQEHSLTFLHNKKYYKQFEFTKASACIVAKDFSASLKPLAAPVLLLRSHNPHLSYAKAVNLMYQPLCLSDLAVDNNNNKCDTNHAFSASKHNINIHPSAYISASAQIGQGSCIAQNVVISDHAKIGPNSFIGANTFIDRAVNIGANAKIYSNISISYSLIGDDVVILPGAKIGNSGFGFAFDATTGKYHRILHLGRVIIGSDVEIGANTTIDRGSLGDTVIENCARIDNLVQIAHNVQIKSGAILAAQSGVAGSSKIGAYAMLGGQAGVAGHLSIGNKSQMAAQAGAIQDVEDCAIVGGTPTMPIRDWHRQSLLLRKLIKSKNY